MALIFSLIGQNAHAVAFTENFDVDPTGGGGIVTTFTTNNGGATFTYTFTGDGDGGDMNWDGGEEDINLLSVFPNSSPTPERVTITRAGSNEFLFNSIEIDNEFGVETVTVEGYNGGIAQGSSQSVTVGASPQTLNFGGLTVDEIRITSTDFDNVHFDAFSGNTTVAANTPPTASSFTAANGPYEDATYTFATANFGYSDGDGDSLSHLLIEALPAAGTLYVDANSSDTYNAGEELSVSDQVSLANLNAGHLQYVQSGSTDTSFQFEVNDGTDTSTGNYVATLNMTPVPTVSIAVSPTSRVESNTTANVITATLSGSYVANTVVNLGFTGTATGADYTVSSSTITIAAGSTTGTANITNVNDGAQEGNETVVVDITSVTNGVENGIQQITYTIVDDDFPPSGYSVALDQASINSINETAVSFTFAGAEIGATYNYTLSSDGGGSNVTGSGTITTATDQITGIDVSGLGDGTLTLSATLTNVAGAGAAATDTVSKDATTPSGHSVTFDQASVTQANETGISFTFAGAEVGANYSYTISSDGGGANVTGSGTLASATAQVSSLDVSGLGDGTLTLSVVLTDTAGNAATAITDTVSKATTPPSGYSVAMDQASISSANETAVSFTFAAAQVGATYNYTLSSDGGGSNVTGSGTITTATDQITGIDVSGLGDGTLTLSATLTNTVGTGVAATDTVSKDATSPSGHSVTFDQASVTPANETGISFTFAGAEVGADYSYTISSDGGGANVTGSGTLASASAQVSSLDVSGLADGTLTLSVVLTDTAGNAAAAVTDTLAKDVQVPTGYSVSFDQAYINATNEAAASFTFAGAEVGTTYQFTISSDGGGANATGSGTIATATDQHTGLDLSGLSDGTLTLSVTLTDSNSNTGVATTDTVTKDVIAPSGYSVSIDLLGEAQINVTNESVIEFMGTGLDVGTTLNYAFTSDGGGAPVTGTETVSAASEQFDNAGAGFDLSGLTDGTITLTVTLEDAAGNVGTDATDTQTKDAGPPTGYTVSWDEALISATEATAAPFTVSNAEISATIDYSISSSGDGNTATVTGSLVATNATQVLSADISSLTDGVLTVEVTLTDASSNSGAPVSDNSASLETTVPSGYSVTIDQAVLEAINIYAVSFTFAGAEVGATYQYTFSSTGGGANVTGSGVVATATDQITGINLSTMAPGTITLSVTLEDAAGNLGAAATASRVLASSALGPTHLPVMGWQALLLMCLALMFTGFISLRYRAG
ncbi:hypothetical protein KO507_06740 [Gilvimarinus agarilyticus]|nr:hypothetical protein [Gilvimarinus agarilyticus]